jgi:Cu+-exporting ATPase
MSESRTIVLVSGMHCAACVSRVEKALQSVPEVDSAFVNLATGQAVVRHEDAVDVEALRNAIERAGYEFEGLDDESSQGAIEDVRRREESALGRRLAVAAAFAIPVVAGSFPAVFGFEANPWVLAFLASPVQFYSGWPFLAGAVGALRARTADMNVLVAMGTLTAYGYSAASTIFPGFFHAMGAGHQHYFDGAVVIITLLLLGRLLELRARGRVSDAIRKLMDLAPPVARVLRDGREVQVPAPDVSEGDLVVVRPGERVPADGQVVSGEATMDESMLTGESVPVEKAPGAEAIGGTVVLSGSLTLRATRVGSRTALQQIVRLVREAQGSRAPVQRLADSVVRVFVPVVLVIACGSLLAWLAFGPAPRINHALLAFVAVLIIACPCAMGLATPTAIMVGTSLGARLGILIRGGESLERARAITTVVFDKTGTLTTGELEVASVVGLSASEDEVLRVAATAEHLSEHPIARAMVRHAESAGLSLDQPRDFRSHAGLGITATVGEAEVVVGTPELVAAHGVDADAAAAVLNDLRAQGRTALVVASGGRVLGVIGVSDSVKPYAPEALHDLRRMGLRLVMITGDHEAVARAVGAEVGIDRVLAGVLPDRKAAAIRELQASGEVVAMAGDGVNDAPALAVADVGIAVGTGSDIAKEASDITLIAGDIRGVGRAIRLARRTYRTIVQNLFWAFGYNVLLIPVAAGVLYPFTGIQLNPALAGFAMAASSVSVVMNSLRLRTFRG